MRRSNKGYINARYIAKQIIAALAILEIDVYVYHISKHDSIYIRFGDARLGSLRIADHASFKNNLYYKWNILKSGTEQYQPYWTIEHGHQYFSSYRDFPQFITELLKFYKTVRVENYPNREYNIPAYKRHHYGPDLKPLKPFKL